MMQGGWGCMISVWGKEGKCDSIACSLFPCLEFISRAESNRWIVNLVPNGKTKK